MKTKILLAFCCLFAFTSFSQDSAFHLKDYKFRTPGYKALTLGISLGGDISNQRNMSDDTLKTKNFHLYPTSISYNSIISTDQRLFTASIMLNSSYDFYSSKEPLNDYKYRSGNENFIWEFDNHFFREGNWYWQLGNKLSNEGNWSKYSQLYEKNNFSVSDEITFGFGKGRTEIVQDAQMALYILNDLNKQGFIGHAPNTETIHSFAKLITQINNRRIFDFRRKRIYELTQIDSFLREKEITNSTDVRHFTTINDNWALGYNPLRSSGKNWFFHLVPFYKIDFAKNSNASNNSSKGTTHTLGGRSEIGYEHYKPINLKWQRDMGATFSWSFDRHHYTLKNIDNGTTSEFKAAGNFNQSRLNLFYGLGYYPNNRTRLNSTFNFATNFDESGYSVGPSLDFSTDYFISYRTRLSGFFSALYQHDYLNFSGIPTNKTHSLNVNFGIGMSHAFL